MGRKKITPDEAVLTATMRVINRAGPSRLTLAEVAREAGLAAATLVQRFGSKRGLLLAVAEMAARGAEACFERVRARHRSPLKGLLAALDEFAGMAETPEALANNLAFLEIDLTDPDFHRLALENARATLAGYKDLFDDAVVAGEIVKCNTRRLARAVAAMAGGSLLSWAILREGPVKKFLRQDVEVLIAPLRKKRRLKT
jgi:AcrR family transcriptional regulator